MKVNFHQAICASFIFIALQSCNTGNDKSSHKSTGDKKRIERIEATPDSATSKEVDLKHRALLESYPEYIKEIEDNRLEMYDGTLITYDDKKDKDFVGRLDDCDVEDMFFTPYSLPDPEPEYLADAGRGRSDALFQKMYGNSEVNVRSHLVAVEWFGDKVLFTSVNGAADSLRVVAKELAKYPELKPYLKSSGTFYWRKVRGANRMSAHSYGIAFDIAVDKSDYWLWKAKGNDELQKIKYYNQIPRKLVEIFQRHGFIWGGAWYHYDTMHFEYRPEIIRYAEYCKSL